MLGANKSILCFASLMRVIFSVGSGDVIPYICGSTQFNDVFQNCIDGSCSHHKNHSIIKIDKPIVKQINKRNNRVEKNTFVESIDVVSAKKIYFVIQRKYSFKLHHRTRGDWCLI